MHKVNKNNFKFDEYTSIKDYFRLILNDWLIVTICIVTAVAGAFLYINLATEYYKSSATIKIAKTKGDILTAPVLPEFTDFGNDRFIANEMQVMKSQSTLNKVAKALSDTLKKNPGARFYNLLVDRKENGTPQQPEPLNKDAISGILGGIEVEQKTGLDIVVISFSSPSAQEAALVVNTFAEVYVGLNKELNRKPMSVVREYLEDQKNQKENELNSAEDDLQKFRSAGKVFSLNEQASILINQLADLDAQRNVAKVDLATSEKVLNNLRQQLAEEDPRLADYLKSLSSQNYIKALQDEIVKLELNRELSQTRQQGNSNLAVVSEYNNKIAQLKKELDSQLEILKAGVFSSSPAEVKELSQKILAEEVKNQSLSIRLNELERISQSYESSFNRLPKTSLELARFERNAASTEKLYSQIEQRYQEALIVEESQPGNIIIIDEAGIPGVPFSPRRKIILFAGLAIGLAAALGFVFIKNYLDDTIKTPEQIERSGFEVLAWIERQKNLDTIDAGSNSTTLEAFRTIRNRIQYYRNSDPSIKSIMITSSTPQEGKSTVSAYLAYSFSKNKQKVILIDCDLRRPKVHQIFNIDPSPGMTDYMSGQADLNKVIKTITSNRLYLITAGAVSSGTEDIWDIGKLHDMFNKLKSEFDIIILDTAPIIVVPETEVLATMSDSSILVISANAVQYEVMARAIKQLTKVNKRFLGTVLNKFKYKTGYSSYYKYTYSYSSDTSDRN